MTIELGLFGLFMLFGSLILIGFVLGKKWWNRMNDKVKTINIDEIEVQTSLTPVELANLPQKYAELQSNWNSLREWLEKKKWWWWLFWLGIR